MPKEFITALSITVPVLLLIVSLTLLAQRKDTEQNKQYTVRFMACVHAGKPASECKLAAQR